MNCSWVSTHWNWSVNCYTNRKETTIHTKRNNTKTQNTQNRKQNVQNNKHKTNNQKHNTSNYEHNYKSTIIHTFHQIYSLHFTPHFSLPSTFRRVITMLQIPSLHLIITLLTIFLKICALQAKVASSSTGSWAYRRTCKIHFYKDPLKTEASIIRIVRI